MLIKVIDDDGSEVYSYDTNAEAKCLFPARDEKARVRGAMLKAITFLCSPPSIKNVKEGA